MSILGERKPGGTMERPAHQQEMVIETDEDQPYRLYIWTATEEARAWLRQELPVYAWWSESATPGGCHLVNLSPCYDRQAVVDWLRSLGQGTPPQQEAAA